MRGGRRREGEGRGDCGELSGTTRGERGEGSAAGEAGGAATWLVRRAGGGDTAWGGRAVAWGGRSGGDVLFFRCLVKGVKMDLFLPKIKRRNKFTLGPTR